jgi:hypothetical protein
MTRPAPCDGACECETPCRACPSLPPYAQLLPFRIPLSECTSATVTQADPLRAGAEGPATGCATLSTQASKRKEGER